MDWLEFTSITFGSEFERLLGGVQPRHPDNEKDRLLLDESINVRTLPRIIINYFCSVT